MGYYDENGIIRTDLLDETAKKTAEGFVKRDVRTKKLISKQSLSSAQLRRFFSEFRQLEKKTNSKGFQHTKPLIKMIKSRANYAANPSNPKIPPSFKDFLIKNVDQIDTEADFRAFMLHFEAVVGFFYGIEGVGSN